MFSKLIYNNKKRFLNTKSAYYNDFWMIMWHLRLEYSRAVRFFRFYQLIWIECFCHNFIFLEIEESRFWIEILPNVKN